MGNAQNAIHFDRAVCGDPIQAEQREWWLANGCGAYAAGTITGALTRRYHGLLIAPVGLSLDRRLILAKADATLHLGGEEWPLFTNHWAGGATSPTGYVNLKSFHLEGTMPIWRFIVGSSELEMRIWMEHGEHTTHVAYRLHGDHTAKLKIILLANARGHHDSTAIGNFNPAISTSDGRLEVEEPDLCRLQIRTSDGQFTADRTWYEHFWLAEEHLRGLNDIDNHLCVGQAELYLAPGQWASITASIESDISLDIESAMHRFQQRQRDLVARAEKKVKTLVSAPPWIKQLVLAADSFLISRQLPNSPDGKSVIAGYPWFGDWGRDTMIALPGLTLVTNRHDDARIILETFAAQINQGMLPNRYVAGGEQPEYNTADATLWFIEAWRTYVEATSDRESLDRVFPVLRGVIDWHINGTRHGIRMDPDDHLLRAGEPGVQLTWMDAKVGERVITPRIGKPVEINALWYNALRAMTGFAAELGLDAGAYEDLALKTKRSFQRYVRASGSGLFDVLDGPDGDDASIRPNQIFAVSLPHSPLDEGAWKGVIAECEHELLTPYGLRSLSPSDPDYRGDYRGGVAERDSAYHQGTVWAWLLGHYALAEYRVTGDAAQAQKRLEPLREHLCDAGLGTISEIFDGDPPHAPRGAPSQAWSVACTLEAWWRLENLKS